MSKIILLNGVGSVGKTSIAKALQALVVRPIWHVEMDAFMSMMPERYMDHPDGLSFAQVGDDPPSLKVQSGPVLEQTLSAMRHAVAGMAEAGCDLVVDDVMIGNTADGDGPAFEAYKRLLSAHDLCLVGVFAPIDVIEARERARKDRAIGLARWQFDRVHVGFEYNLTVDTGQHSPEVCAGQIKRAFDL